MPQEREPLSVEMSPTASSISQKLGALKQALQFDVGLIHDWALFLALSRSEQYSAECELFERKYGMKLEELENRLHREKGMEDFEQEEDLDDWEFCLNAMKWWKDKVKELQSASDAQ